MKERYYNVTELKTEGQKNKRPHCGSNEVKTKSNIHGDF